MDIYNYFGGDLGITSSGDLKTVDTVIRGQQRILRRLLTPPGSYIWHVNYGAGLPQYVGVALSHNIYLKIQGVVLTQMQLEASVAKTPAPTVSLQQIPNGLFCNITYIDDSTNTQQILNFTVTK